MDFSLSADQREIQALAREFADAEIQPHAAEWDREHRFPRELFAKLAELGLMGVCIPEELGGAGADFLSYMLVLEELSRADAAAVERCHRDREALVLLVQQPVRGDVRVLDDNVHGRRGVEPELLLDASDANVLIDERVIDPDFPEMAP